ncbi:response regulator transcription factor [Paenibacillus sp. MMO-58]|uniref:response regulator transcription factor n=1 Tax=Paenibacillus sp. MMO-58 TaxID=3081290 RepID=UPI003018D14A
MYKALHVHPDTISREEIRLMLPWEQYGFRLHEYADSLSDAQEILSMQTFDLILIDLKFSQTAGMRICEQIREHSRVPIILLGGSHDFQLLRKAIAFQVSDYIVHPVQPEDLAASLCKVKKELDAQYSKRLTLSYENKKNQNPSIIDLVKHYVQERLHENITLKKISTMLHFNCAYLGQKFKDQENMSFNEYLLQQRMEKAKFLLEQTDMRIYEIANQVGYTEIDWFYKKFKEYTGSSANEYRKQSTVYA